MTDRQRLPARRRQTTAELQYDQHDYLVSVGFDDAGQVREVFTSGQRQGSTLDATLDDAAIVISIALQRGATAAELHHSMSRLGGGLGAATSPASPIGAVVDLVARVERETAGPPHASVDAWAVLPIKRD